MHVGRRQLLVSAAVVVCLVVPAMPSAVAGTGPGGLSSGKQQVVKQLKNRSRTLSEQRDRSARGPLNRLASERDSGRVIIAVKVRPGSRGTAAALAAVAGSARAQGGKQRRSVPRLNTVTVEMPASATKAFTAKMHGRADVAAVELVPRRVLSLIPDDESYPATGGYLNAVTAPAAWDVHAGDPRVKIAVVDTGVDVNHPDLAGRVTATYNAVPDVTDVTDVTDSVGHGTFVAGVAAATGNNGIGIAGASLGASVIAVKVADSDGIIWTDVVASGIVWAADNGADIINLSLGGATSSAIERDAVAYAVGKGVLVVAAAGNESDTTPQYPAAHPQVIAVGATDGAGARAGFSSYGTWVTTAAPGIGITGTTPVAGSDFWPTTSGYAVSQGTSFSSPLVAAEAALLWSLRPAVSASDVRQAIVKSSHGYANLGLGAGQVDFRAAFDALRPESVPALTMPADGATLTGVVRLSATSTAPKVRFLVNGVPTGVPVTTVAGSASTTWTSWGLANGPRTATAVDCSLRDLCSTSSAPAVRATLANAAPVMTSPKAAQTLSGSASFTATAPGGGVAFFIDNVRRGFDGSAPYAITYSVSSLADGAHSVRAVSCSTAGTACAGPTSASVSFTNRSLHPRFTKVSPSLFSPNGDGRRDTTTATYYLPDTEAVRFQIRNAAGTIVRGPNSLGTLTAGTRTRIWNGLYNGGARAANGVYTIELTTSRSTTSGTLRGYAAAHVTVDRTAPTMSSITGNGATFNPYPDGYRDLFTTKLTLSEKATVTMTVRTADGSLVRSFAGSKPKGATSVAWNGTNNAGKRVAAGRYYWVLTAQDPAGNRRASARYSVVVSAKRLVTRTATLSRRGYQYASAGGSAACAGASRSASDFSPYGVWLPNMCSSSDGPQIAAATYRFTVPAAYSRSSLKVQTYGNSFWAPSTLGVGFTKWGTNSWTTRQITAGAANAWRTVGTVATSGLVSSSRLVETTLYVANDYTTSSDFDISWVRLVVTYKVLV